MKLKQCIISKYSPISGFWDKFNRVVWELMKLQTKLNKLEGKLDKKIHKITEKMKSAEKDMKGGKPKAASKVLKGAEKKNEKLKVEDRDVRDPMISKFKKAKKEMC
jgi:hypothetical protein